MLFVRMVGLSGGLIWGVVRVGGLGERGGTNPSPKKEVENKNYSSGASGEYL